MFSLMGGNHLLAEPRASPILSPSLPPFLQLICDLSNFPAHGAGEAGGLEQLLTNDSCRKWPHWHLWFTVILGRDSSKAPHFPYSDFSPDSSSSMPLVNQTQTRPTLLGLGPASQRELVVSYVWHSKWKLASEYSCSGPQTEFAWKIHTFQPYKELLLMYWVMLNNILIEVKLLALKKRHNLLQSLKPLWRQMSFLICN